MHTFHVSNQSREALEFSETDLALHSYRRPVSHALMATEHFGVEKSIVTLVAQHFAQIFGIVDVQQVLGYSRLVGKVLGTVVALVGLRVARFVNHHVHRVIERLSELFATNMAEGHVLSLMQMHFLEMTMQSFLQQEVFTANVTLPVFSFLLDYISSS